MKIAFLLLALIQARATEDRLAAVKNCLISYKDTQRNVDVCIGGAKNEHCPANLPEGDLMWRLAPQGKDQTLHLATMKSGKLAVFTNSYDGEFFETRHLFRVGEECYHVEPRGLSSDKIAPARKQLCSTKEQPSNAFSEDELLADLMARIGTDLRGLFNEFQNASPPAAEKEAVARYAGLMKFNEEPCRGAVMTLEKSSGFDAKSKLGEAIAHLKTQLDGRKKMAAANGAAETESSPKSKKGRD